MDGERHVQSGRDRPGQEICVLFRAEDNSATGIGKRTSRIGLARSADGVTMRLRDAPVLFPAEDAMKECDWPGGCEDPAWPSPKTEPM